MENMEMKLAHMFFHCGEMCAKCESI